MKKILFFTLLVFVFVTGCENSIPEIKALPNLLSIKRDTKNPIDIKIIKDSKVIENTRIIKGTEDTKVDLTFRENFENTFDLYFQKYPGHPFMMDEKGNIIVLESFPEPQRGDRENLGEFILAKPRRG